MSGPCSDPIQYKEHPTPSGQQAMTREVSNSIVSPTSETITVRWLSDNALQPGGCSTIACSNGLIFQKSSLPLCHCGHRNSAVEAASEGNCGRWAEVVFMRERSGRVSQPFSISEN